MIITVLCFWCNEINHIFKWWFVIFKTFLPNGRHDICPQISSLFQICGQVVLFGSFEVRCGHGVLCPTACKKRSLAVNPRVAFKPMCDWPVSLFPAAEVAKHLLHGSNPKPGPLNLEEAEPPCQRLWSHSTREGNFCCVLATEAWGPFVTWTYLAYPLSWLVSLLYSFLCCSLLPIIGSHSHFVSLENTYCCMCFFI